MRLTNEQLVFLGRFAKSPEGHAMLDFLKVKLGERDKALRTEIGENLYRTQGRAAEIDELIADITQARAHLERQFTSQRKLPIQEPI